MPSSYPADLIDFLQSEDSFPHNPGNVEHIQTHISHLFIAPPFVYKFKKAVNLDFLDFSTLEKRRYFCEQELILNRRLCEDIYIELVAVCRTEEGYAFCTTEADHIVEYAVKMKQLSKEHFLITDVRNGNLQYSQIDRVIDRLCRFFSTQSHGEEIAMWAEPEQIKKNAGGNFRQVRPYLGQTLTPVMFDTIQLYTERFLEQENDLFQKRIQNKRIVDGHGDLHLEHIHIKNNRVCIYDCIEFNERFRYLDVTADIAFLAMDLDYHNCRLHSRYFTEQMAERLSDPDMNRLIGFYKCYRAFIRGMVNSMKASEENPGRLRAARDAEDYFKLSLYCALTGSSPAVFIFSGRVASGKSTLARELAEQLNTRCFSSDPIRKTLAGQAPAERTPESAIAYLYGEKMSERTYDQLAARAKSELKEGRSAILDATYGRQKDRQNLIRHLEEENIHYCFVEAVAPDAIRKERLAKRDEVKGAISDARLDNLGMLDARYQPPDEIPEARRYRIHTDRSLNETVKELHYHLVERQLQKERTHHHITE